MNRRGEGEETSSWGGGRTPRPVLEQSASLADSSATTIDSSTSGDQERSCFLARGPTCQPQGKEHGRQERLRLKGGPVEQFNGFPFFIYFSIFSNRNHIYLNVSK